MEHYLIGTLIENKDGATYEGVVFDRFLKFRTRTGETVAIFDPPFPISAELLVGVQYELLLVSLVVPGTTRLLQKLLPCERQDILYGTVTKQEWLGKPEEYSYAHGNKLRKGEWILMKTTWGNLLISTEELEISVTVGQSIRWESLRLDLLAIV